MMDDTQVVGIMAAILCGADYAANLDRVSQERHLARDYVNEARTLLAFAQMSPELQAELIRPDSRKVGA